MSQPEVVRMSEKNIFEKTPKTRVRDFNPSSVFMAKKKKKAPLADDLINESKHLRVIP